MTDSKIAEDNMVDMDFIFQRLTENEKIQKKFYQLESKILSILNFKDFFEILLTEMMTIFKIPCVWMSVIKESQLADLINQINDSDIIRKRTNFISSYEFFEIIGEDSAPVLINNSLESYAAFFPNDMVYPIGSLAITPVLIDGEVVGSLNQWDVSPSRFEPDMDTSFLQQLTMKISICLSNVSAHEKLHFYAYHDPLTGLLNRRAFEGAISREYSRARRHESALSMVYLDLDSFKQINDTYGHDIGDIALIHVANALESHIRKEDVVSRLAGDEFAILLPETNEEAAAAMMERIDRYLSRYPVESLYHSLRLSISYGISSSADAVINTPDQLMKKADERLYDIKKQKKISIKKEPVFERETGRLGIN